MQNNNIERMEKLIDLEAHLEAMRERIKEDIDKLSAEDLIDFFRLKDTFFGASND
jgi:hypothetical protein